MVAFCAISESFFCSIWTWPVGNEAKREGKMHLTEFKINMDQEWIDSVSFQTISNFSWFTDLSILVLPKNYNLWPRRDFEEIQKIFFLREWSFLRNYCRLVQKLIGAKKITKYYLLLLNFGIQLGIVSIQSARSKVDDPEWAVFLYHSRKRTETLQKVISYSYWSHLLWW